jgi:hypothetical protein
VSPVVHRISLPVYHACHAALVVYKHHRVPLHVYHAHLVAMWHPMVKLNVSYVPLVQHRIPPLVMSHVIHVHLVN